MRIPHEKLKRFFGLEILSFACLSGIAMGLVTFHRFIAGTFLFSLACIVVGVQLLIRWFEIPQWLPWKAILIPMTAVALIWFDYYLIGVVGDARDEYYSAQISSLAKIPATAQKPTNPEVRDAGATPAPILSLAHIRIKSINLMPMVENAPLELKVSYENDGAEDTEFRFHYGNALKLTPEDVNERRKIEDEIFSGMVKTMTSKNPLTTLPTHREMEDTLKCPFPQNVINEFKAGKRKLIATGRIQYHDSGVWNHSDYCVVFSFDAPQPLSCVRHNEEPHKH